MNTLSCKRSDMPTALAQSIFADRGRQFVDRLKWDLCVSPEGLETDQYDDPHSDYVLVREGAQHMGSLRLRPFSSGTMLFDHFLHQFPEAEAWVKMQRGKVMELTRFCRDPALSVTESRSMLRVLAVALDRYRDENNLTGFVAVVFPQVARFLDTIGVRYMVLSKSKLAGKTVVMICLTHAVAVADQAARLNPQPALDLVA